MKFNFLYERKRIFREEIRDLLFRGRIFPKVVGGVLAVTLPIIGALSFENFFLNRKIEEKNTKITYLITENSSYALEKANLQRLNEEVLLSLDAKIDEMKESIPASNLFSNIENLVGGASNINLEQLTSSKDLESIIARLGEYSFNIKDELENWKNDKFNVKNLIPKNPNITLPIPANGETRITQEMGPNINIVVIGPGNHEGIDYINKEDSWPIASSDYRVKSDVNYSALPDSDSRKKLWGERGRMVELYLLDESDGYRYLISLSHLSLSTKRLAIGKIIKKEERIGVRIGETGMASGPHAHAEIRRQKIKSNGKTKTYGKLEIYNPYENRVTDIGIVPWYLGNLPASIKKTLSKYIGN